MNRIVLFAFLLMVPFLASSQEALPEMASQMYESGKIYVVVSVALIILAGIIFYLLMLDRKMTRIERKAGIKE